MKPLYGFFQDDKWYEDAGHILIGLVPMWGWIREDRQWPPGDTIHVDVLDRVGVVTPRPYAPHDRVADSYRDFLGYAIGATIRCVGLIGVVTWLLVR